VEVCPFESIRMDNIYEVSSYGRFGDLVVHKNQLLKSNEYYHQIHPTDAAETDARIEAARVKKAAAAKAAAEKAAAAKAAKEAEAQAAATTTQPEQPAQ